MNQVDELVLFIRLLMGIVGVKDEREVFHQQGWEVYRGGGIFGSVKAVQ